MAYWLRQTDKPKEKVEPPPEPVIKGLSQAEVDKLLEEQDKAWRGMACRHGATPQIQAHRAKVAALEKRIKMLEDEIKKLKAKETRSCPSVPCLKSERSSQGSTGCGLESRSRRKR